MGGDFVFYCLQLKNPVGNPKILMLFPVGVRVQCSFPMELKFQDIFLTVDKLSADFLTFCFCRWIASNEEWQEIVFLPFVKFIDTFFAFSQGHNYAACSSTLIVSGDWANSTPQIDFTYIHSPKKRSWTSSSSSSSKYIS